MAKSKRYVYYQPNKKDIKDKTGDCQVRALSKALGISWLDTYSFAFDRKPNKISVSATITTPG